MSWDEKQYYSSLLGVSNFDLPTFRAEVLMRQNGPALILISYYFAIFTF